MPKTGPCSLAHSGAADAATKKFLTQENQQHRLEMAIL